MPSNPQLLRIKPPADPRPDVRASRRAILLALMSPVFFGLAAWILYAYRRQLALGQLSETLSGGALIVLWLFVLPSLPGLVLALRVRWRVDRKQNLTAYRNAGDAIVFASLAPFLDFFLGALAILSRVKHTGRLFRVRGRVRTAPAVQDPAWASSEPPQLPGLDPDTRAALAADWLADARAEHASIAAFSRLSLELMAAGAPPRLLEATHRAALDEIRHARLCFALASAYGGEDLGPAPFPEAVEPARLRSPTSRLPWLLVLATDSLRDGCLAEGYAARGAAEALRHATDPAVRSALEAIAADEARHAELAWHILAWCLEHGGRPVRDAVEVALAGLELALPSARPLPTGVQPELLAAHGRLDSGTLHRLRDETLALVLARAARTLPPLRCCEPDAALAAR